MELTTLVKKAKNGDGDAFINLVKQYEGVLYKVASRLLANDEDVADAMQETIMMAFQNISKLKKDEYFNTWICKILINKCNSILNKKKNIIFVDKFLEQKNDKNDFEKLELEDMINSLESHYKMVIVLYYISGMNTKEISKLLKEPEGTIKSKIYRAKSILREKYYKDGGIAEYGK